jgi:protein-S-isoprenylcysteine O-methyltransferase Ste14
VERTLSVLAYAILVGVALVLVEHHALLAHAPALVIVQLVGVACMLWARVVFGARSFHLAADATPGELVTRGPYAWVRNPIYTGAILAIWAGIAGHASALVLACGVVATLALVARALLEERSLRRAYGEYASYAARVKRFVPFVV